MKRTRFDEMSADARRVLELLGVLRTYRGTVVIAHPRQASVELVELLDLLAGRDVGISIERFSPYCPDSFFSVVLWQPQDEILAAEYIELARGGSWESERQGRVVAAAIN